ncbi:MAG TPA: hypothetical protein VGF67_21735 [Ktedonobacteraceae bacterium]|jgi:uncharacterized protein YcaQ
MQQNPMYQPVGAQHAAAFVPDKHYDLISVLYHALQSVQIYRQYAEDAGREGDQELAQFFQQVQQNQLACAQKARQLLGQRLGQSLQH